VGAVVVQDRQVAAGAASVPPALPLGQHRLPLSFEVNRGQADRSFSFVTHAAGYSVALSPTEVVLAATPRIPPLQSPGLLARAGRDARESSRSLHEMERDLPRVAMHLAGARSVRLTGVSRLPGHVNYLIGNNPKGWLTDIPTYARVEAMGVYPGIDLTYYSTAGMLENDWIIHPGANPDAIRFRVSGARTLLDDAGNLVLRTGYGDLVEGWPHIYQTIGGRRHPVGGGYQLEGSGRVGFHLKRYDRTRPLVIDPTTTWSDLLGGSGADQAAGVEVDGTGNSYVTGTTNSTNFPATAGAFSTSLTGTINVFVLKLNPSGSQIDFSTYLGGNGADEVAKIKVIAAGDAIVAGTTTSTNFPTFNPFQSSPVQGACPANPYPGSDKLCPEAFVSELNPAGSALLFSAVWGGAGVGGAPGATQVFGLALDGSGNAFIDGVTSSATGFPIKNAYQPTYGGGPSNGFVTVIGPTGALEDSTFYGGTGTDELIGVDVDSLGHLYVTGDSTSPGLRGPGATGDQISAIMARFTFSAGNALVRTGTFTTSATNPAVALFGEYVKFFIDPNTGAAYVVFGVDVFAPRCSDR
jgi:hypothetical protein